MADIKLRQLKDLLLKSIGYITANITLLDQEIIRFALQDKTEQMTHGTSVIVEITKLLDCFPIQGSYEPKEIPPKIAEKLNSTKRSVINRVDSLIWEINAKLFALQEVIENSTNEIDKNIAVRITATNQIVQNYVNSLTLSKQALPSDLNS